MDDKTDAELTADVYAAIDADQAASVMDLGVIGNDGDVTLDGTTATLISKEAAGRAASRVAGVRVVTNAIAVDPVALGVREDEQIRSDVQGAFVLDTMVPLDVLSVAVDDGVVTLSGEVEDAHQRELAEDDTRQIPGVRKVVNLITVNQQLD